MVEPMPSSKNIWLPVLISVLATAIIIGGGIYLWQHSKVTNLTADNQELEQQERLVINKQPDVIEANTECVLDKNKYIVFEKSELPQIEYPRIDMNLESLKTEINKKVIEPYIEYTKNKEYEILHISIFPILDWGNAEESTLKELEIETVLLYTPTGSIMKHSFDAEMENGSINFFNPEYLEKTSPIGYRG